MTIEDLIATARARLVYLSSQRETAVRLGDDVQLSIIDKEYSETQTTLNVLLGAV